MIQRPESAQLDLLQLPLQNPDYLLDVLGTVDI